MTSCVCLCADPQKHSEPAPDDILPCTAEDTATKSPAHDWRVYMIFCVHTMWFGYLQTPSGLFVCCLQCKCEWNMITYMYIYVAPVALPEKWLSFVTYERRFAIQTGKVYH